MSQGFDTFAPRFRRDTTYFALLAASAGAPPLPPGATDLAAGLAPNPHASDLDLATLVDSERLPPLDGLAAASPTVRPEPGGLPDLAQRPRLPHDHRRAAAGRADPGPVRRRAQDDVAARGPPACARPRWHHAVRSGLPRPVRDRARHAADALRRPRGRRVGRGRAPSSPGRAPGDRRPRRLARPARQRHDRGPGLAHGLRRQPRHGHGRAHGAGRRRPGRLVPGIARRRRRRRDGVHRRSQERRVGPLPRRRRGPDDGLWAAVVPRLTPGRRAPRRGRGAGPARRVRAVLRRHDGRRAGGDGRRGRGPGPGGAGRQRLRRPRRRRHRHPRDAGAARPGGAVPPPLGLGRARRAPWSSATTSRSSGTPAPTATRRSRWSWAATGSSTRRRPSPCSSPSTRSLPAPTS